MLTLYYSPGACSLAAHVVLEEAGAEFEAKPVLLAKGEHLTEDYLKINPRARVPALRVGDEVLTENVAILPYVARRFPAAKLLPFGDALAEARCLSWMGFLSSTVHIAFATQFRPARFASDPAVHPELKSTGRAALSGMFQEIEAGLAGRDWVMGDYSVCDPYLMVFYRWGLRIDVPMMEYAAWSRHMDRIQQRPAVSAVLEREGLLAM